MNSPKRLGRISLVRQKLTHLRRQHEPSYARRSNTLFRQRPVPRNGRERGEGGRDKRRVDSSGGTPTPGRSISGPHRTSRQTSRRCAELASSRSLLFRAAPGIARKTTRSTAPRPWACLWVALRAQQIPQQMQDGSAEAISADGAKSYLVHI